MYSTSCSCACGMRPRMQADKKTPAAKQFAIDMQKSRRACLAGVDVRCPRPKSTKGSKMLTSSKTNVHKELAEITVNVTP